MKVAKIPNPGATLALGMFFLVANMVAMVYALHRLQPSASFLWLYYLGSALVVTYWILADGRRLGVSRVVDQGFFLIAAWPVCLPYHLFKTRRLKGAVTLVGLLGVYLLSYALSLVFFYLLRRAEYGK